MAMRRVAALSQHLAVVDVDAAIAPEPCAAVDLSPTDEFSGKVAVVTGGARGLGLAIARRLGVGGAAVCLIDVREEDLKLAIAQLKDDSIPNVLKVVCDVTSEAAVAKAFATIEATEGFGRIDILVQAAGITGKTGIQSHQVELDNFDQVFAVNMRGIFLCSKAVLPGMLNRNYGRIVNMASISGKEGNAGMLAYSASKAAVIAATKVMGKEYAETGITVNCIAPAVVRTQMVAAMPEEQVKYMTDKIPMKRCGTETEIADLAAFIASKRASFTTAFCFDASGGRATY